MIPPINNREIIVNTPSKCSVNDRYTDVTIKVQFIDFHLFYIRQNATDWSGYYPKKESLFGLVSAAG